LSSGEYKRDGAPCRGAAVRRNTLALLALLAAADKNGASRDKLIAFLWPESDTEHGRNLLRQACFALRRDLHQPELILGATELRLNPEAVSSDVHAFADALERGDLAGAVALYGGPFLDGFYLRGSDEFERWAETERGRLAKQVCAVLEALATQALAGADHRAAEQWWHRLAALDPLSSHAALGLMTALAAGGDRAGAIRHARVHEAMLRRELGTAPEAAVTRLAERLRAEAAPPESSEAAPALAGHTVGREAERGELRAGLASALAGRSVMLCVRGAGNREDHARRELSGRGDGERPAVLDRPGALLGAPGRRRSVPTFSGGARGPDAFRPARFGGPPDARRRPELVRASRPTLP